MIAETCARTLLMAKGYRILAQRYRCKLGEIDLIASRGNVCVFIEVKARPDTDTALESVRINQRERIERAALMYLTEHPAQQQKEIRFDVITCRPWRAPSHLPDAWRPGM